MLQQQAQQQQQMYQQQKGYGQQGNSQPGYGTQAYGTQYVATGNHGNKQQGWGSAYGNFKPFWGKKRFKGSQLCNIYRKMFSHSSNSKDTVHLWIYVQIIFI